jgi:hypothetical protein
MPTDIKQVVLVIDSSRDAANLLISFENDGRNATLGKLPRSG